MKVIHVAGTKGKVSCLGVGGAVSLPVWSDIVQNLNAPSLIRFTKGLLV
jgi:folylpolyglutamate synthase/dihydropteroate synthase